MSAVILSFPDRRGNRPSPLQPPPQSIEDHVRSYCYKLGLSNFDRNSVLRALQHWQQCGVAPDQVAARSMAMANRIAMSPVPDPNGPRAA